MCCQLLNVQTGSGAHPDCQWVQGALSLGVKRPGCGAIKNEWSCTATPSRSHHNVRRDIMLEALRAQTWRGTILYCCCPFIVLLLYIYCIVLVTLLYCSCPFIVLLLYIYCIPLVHLLYFYTFIVLLLYIYCTSLVHLLYCSCTFIVFILYIYCTALVYLLYCSCIFIVLFLYIYCTALVHLLYCSRTFILLLLSIYCIALVHLLYCYGPFIVLLFYVYSIALVHLLYFSYTFIVLLLYIYCIALLHLFYCSCTRNVIITWRSALLSNANVGDGQTDDYKLFACFMRRTHETLMSCPVRLILGVFKTNVFPPTLPGYSLCPKTTFLNWRVGSFEIQRAIISFVPLCLTPSLSFTPSCLSPFIRDSEM